MTPTPPLAKQADLACVYANGAAARGKKSSDKRKLAARLRALAMIQDLRRAGITIERKHEKALRG